MILDYTYRSSDIHTNNIRAMLMSSGDYAEYLFRVFPYELNDLTDMKCLYPSLIVEIYHLRMPIKTTKSRCLVQNALVAVWPGKLHSDVAVVEFRTIQHAYKVEPDIRQCKRILINLIASQWGVTFKGKEMVVC